MFEKPSAFLGASKYFDGVGYSVTEVELEHAVNAGIYLRSLAPHVVPLYEEHEARLKYQYSLKDWYAMEPMERALVVATVRVSRSIHNHQNEAEAKAAKAQLPKKK